MTAYCGPLSITDDSPKRCRVKVWPEHVAIMVLKDGSTHTDIEGCTILFVAEAEYDRLMQGDTDIDAFLDAGAEEVVRFEHE